MVVDSLDDVPVSRLLGYAALVSLTVILLRFAWVFVVHYAPKRVVGRMTDARGAVFLSWAGMRGAVSLAAALALPFETDSGDPFPGRELVVFLTFTVILVTLVGQGLTLPLVIRWLGLQDDGLEEREDAKARIQAAEAALVRLEELIDEDWVREDTAERVRGPTASGRRASARGSTTGTTVPSSFAPRTTSACAASCSMPSARRSSSCAVRRDQQRRLDPGRPRPRPRGRAARHLSRRAVGR